MPDAALRRTVRRCTALLLLQFAVVSAQLYDAFGGGGSTTPPTPRSRSPSGRAVTSS